MATPLTPTGTVQHAVYVLMSHVSKDEDTYAKLSATGKLIVAANLLGDVIAFGPITKTGNPSEWTPFGSGTTRSIAGAASLGELTVRFVVSESNAIQGRLYSASIGDKIEVAGVKNDGTGMMAYYAYGTLASTEVTFDTPGEYGFTIALADSPRRAE